MNVKTRKKVNRVLFYLLLLIVAVIYIYPVFLMFMNSFKPFGEIVRDAIAMPTKPEIENYTYVVD